MTSHKMLSSWFEVSRPASSDDYAARRPARGIFFPLIESDLNNTNENERS